MNRVNTRYLLAVIIASFLLASVTYLIAKTENFQCGPTEFCLHQDSKDTFRGWPIRYLSVTSYSDSTPNDTNFSTSKYLLEVLIWFVICSASLIILKQTKVIKHA